MFGSGKGADGISANYTANENSVNTKGTLQQPYYWNKTYNSSAKTGAWQKLTYSTYSLDNIIAVGGDGTNDWNRNGVSVSNPALSNQVIDYSKFNRQGANKGIGTITSTGIVKIGGYKLKITNSYELQKGKSFIIMKTIVKNIDAKKRTVKNLRFWTGTQDDYIAGDDANSKSRGNFIDGVYKEVRNPKQQAKVVKIFNGTAGIYFYSISPKADTIISTRYKLKELLATAPFSHIRRVHTDGSYAIYMRLNDLAYGKSESFTVYYAAGALKELDALALDVSKAAETGKIIHKNKTTTFKENNFKDKNTYSKIKITTLPKHGVLKIFGDPLVVNQTVVNIDYKNMTYTPDKNYMGKDEFHWQGFLGYGNYTAKLNTILNIVK